MNLYFITLNKLEQLLGGSLFILGSQISLLYYSSHLSDSLLSGCIFAFFGIGLLLLGSKETGITHHSKIKKHRFKRLESIVIKWPIQELIQKIPLLDWIILISGSSIGAALCWTFYSTNATHLLFHATCIALVFWGIEFIFKDNSPIKAAVKESIEIQFKLSQIKKNLNKETITLLGGAILGLLIGYLFYHKSIIGAVSIATLILIISKGIELIKDDI